MYRKSIWYFFLLQVAGLHLLAVWRKSAGKAAFLGTDKLLKCPIIFNSADVVVITKVDLATAVEFNSVAANRNI